MSDAFRSPRDERDPPAWLRTAIEVFSCVGAVTLVGAVPAYLTFWRQVTFTEHPGVGLMLVLASAIGALVWGVGRDTLRPDGAVGSGAVTGALGAIGFWSTVQVLVLIHRWNVDLVAYATTAAVWWELAKQAVLGAGGAALGVGGARLARRVSPQETDRMRLAIATLGALASAFGTYLLPTLLRDLRSTTAEAAVGLVFAPFLTGFAWFVFWRIRYPARDPWPAVPAHVIVGVVGAVMSALVGVIVGRADFVGMALFFGAVPLMPLMGVAVGFAGERVTLRRATFGSGAWSWRTSPLAAGSALFLPAACALAVLLAFGGKGFGALAWPLLVGPAVVPFAWTWRAEPPGSGPSAFGAVTAAAVCGSGAGWCGSIAAYFGLGQVEPARDLMIGTGTAGTLYCMYVFATAGLGVLLARRRSGVGRA